MPRLLITVPLLALAFAPAAHAQWRPAVCVYVSSPGRTAFACDPLGLNSPPRTGCPTAWSPAYGYAVSVCTTT